MTETIYKPIEEVARKFSVGPATIRTWIRSGAIPRNTFVRAGNTYRFDVDAVTRALMEGHEPEEQAPLGSTPYNQYLPEADSIEDPLDLQAIADLDDDV